jgi:hypothetical protein
MLTSTPLAPEMSISSSNGLLIAFWAGAPLPFGDADPHHGHAAFTHDRLDVGEVDVDQTAGGNEVRNALHRLLQYIVGRFEGVEDAGVFPRKTEQAVVGDDDQRVDDFLELFDAVFGFLLTLPALPGKGFGHHSHRQGSHFPGDFRDNRRSSGTRAAAETGGDEYHVRPVQDFRQPGAVFLGRLTAHLRIRSGAQPLGQFAAELYLERGETVAQSLCIGVGTNEIHPFHMALDHGVDGIAATTANADNLDFCRLVDTFIKFKHDSLHSPGRVQFSAITPVCLVSRQPLYAP